MRSTICISVVAGMVASSALAPMAMAQPLVTEGCFARTYSPDHLAANPGQIVAAIVIRSWDDPGYGNTLLEMSVEAADQGHAAASGHGGQTLTQGLFCMSPRSPGAGVFCGIECDGGSLEVLTDDGATFMFRTISVAVGETESCGGAVSLAEVPGQFTSYRLDRVSDSICEEVFR